MNKIIVKSISKITSVISNIRNKNKRDNISLMDHKEDDMYGDQLFGHPSITEINRGLRKEK